MEKTRRISTDIPSGEIAAFPHIRVLACFCIILLHALFASNVYFEETMTGGEVLWSKAMENELMWAVPCFLMITGALLLDPARKLPLKKLFGKYLRRIVLALVCFTLIFQILGWRMEGEPNIVKGCLQDLAFGESWAHMWYLYLMIGLYLMMPFYKMIADKAVTFGADAKAGQAETLAEADGQPCCDTRLLDLLILILLVFTSLVPMAEVFGISIGFYIPTTLVYPAYLFMGYRLHNKPWHPGLAAVLLVVCTAGLLGLTWLRYGTGVLADMEADPANQLDTLTGYASILVIFQTAGLFCLLERIKTPAGRALRSMDQCSFGIYLIHMIGIHLIMKWMGFDPYMYGPFTFILMAAALFLASWPVTWVIRKIPKLNLL